MFGQALALLLLSEPVRAQLAYEPARFRSMGRGERMQRREAIVNKAEAREVEQEVWDRVLQSSMSMSMDVPTASPTPGPTVLLGPCNITDAAREQGLLTLLGDTFPDAALTDLTTNEGRAFDFILNEEDFVVCPNDPLCPTKAINRFVSALFYFDTNGQDWVNCGADSAECNPDGIMWGPNNEFQTSDCYEGSANRWLSGTDECTWCGLSCDDAEGIGEFTGVPRPTPDNCFLTDIRLEEINQSGILTPELGALSELLTIQLENGAIEGNIPSTFGALLNLGILDLNFQNLVGPIPEELYLATNLIEIDLNDNGLTGTISQAIATLEQLLFLDVGNNLLGGPLPAGFANLNFLSALGLYNNDFTGQMPTLNSVLLTTVLIEGNQLTGADLDWLQLTPSPFSQPPEIQLTTLDVKNNLFSGTIPVRLGNATNLQFASFFNNDITGTMPDEVCDLTPDPLANLESDCDDTDGPPEIECECCTFCNIQ